MSYFRIVSLYSGSGGNSTLVGTGEGALLIDAGKSARALGNALRQAGSEPDKLKAVFITHEHTDHISALEVLLKKHPMPVHMTAASADNLHLPYGSRLRDCILTHTPVYSERVGDVTVTSFPLSHDSAMCVGYRVSTDGGFSFGVATDTGCVTDELLSGLCGCDAVEIESNHSVEMLRSGPYPAELKRRILSRRGHLSNDDCASLARHLAENGTKNFLLAHLSRENNCPEAAMVAVGEALSVFDGVSIRVAKPEEETVFVNINE